MQIKQLSIIFLASLAVANEAIKLPNEGAIMNDVPPHGLVFTEDEYHEDAKEVKEHPQFFFCKLKKCKPKCCKKPKKKCC